MDRLLNVRAALMAALCIILGASTASRADRYDVRIFKYDNNGAYKACMELHWLGRSTDGSVGKAKYSIRADNLPGNVCATQGKSASLNLDNIKRKDKPSPGDEVWLMINIRAGDNKGCRKDGTKFIYQSDGGIAKVRTGGTTLNNNRCKISCRDCKP